MAETTEELFERAVLLHSRRLHAIARAIVGYRASPEDVVQQAVMNLYQHRDRYDWRQPGGLLRRSVVNEALRLLRQPKMAAFAEDFSAASYHSPQDAMMNDELVKKVRAAIDQLPEHFRAALVLCEYENMSYDQIADVLDVTIPQVKTWLHRGRKQLAAKLKGFVESEK